MYPDFLGIGAQKSGTAWLYENLRIHNEISMTPVKELNYFNETTPIPNVIRMFKSKWMLSQLKWSVQRSLREKRNIQIGWFLRFYFLLRNDRWYSSLFSSDLGQKTGEVNPAYSILTENVVARIQHLMPNLRIIYLLRNPILRTWSQAALHFRIRGRKLENVRDEELFETFGLDWVSRHSYYLRNLEKWEKFYSENQIFIGFFDQLSENPRDLLRNIYNFLEVDSSQNVIPDSADRKMNSGKYPEIPIRFSGYLAHKYYDQIKQLHTRFANRYTADWLEFAEKCL
ncbi:MAG: sulfotransferase domain-containing protein [Thermodesulfobacteriota bacterium]